MRIGLVTDFYYPWIGGPSAVVRNLGHGLSARGHSVFLLAPSPDGAPRTEMDGPVAVTRARTAPVPFGYRMRSALPFDRTARRWLQTVRPDVVNVHHPFPLSAAATFAADKADVPVIATNHTIPECSLWGIRDTGPLYNITRAGFSRWIVHLLERCSAIATPTVTAAGLLKGMGCRRDITAISNGIDTVRFHPGVKDSALRRSFNLEDRPVVLYTGRLDAEKQMDVWFQAAQILSHSLDVNFLVGGKGTERARLERRASELGLDERIHFMSYLPEDEFPDVYHLADVFFITSPVELQSITTLEAVSSGLPVVAVRAAALPELVLDGKNGFLVEPGDYLGAAQALQEVLTQPDLSSRMGNCSREIAIRHDISFTIDCYEELFTAAIRQSGGGIAA